MGRAATAKKLRAVDPALKLDLGCGPHPREGFAGVDRLSFPGVTHVVDLTKRWPWKDATVDEAHASHVLEHFTATERVHVVNELYRVLKPGASCQIVVPHWASCRAYGDPTHQWPPVSEFWFYYLSKAWRADNAPHTDAAHWSSGFTCDFEPTWGYNVRPDLVPRNPEYQQFAIQNYKEAALDLIATLKKRGAA